VKRWRAEFSVALVLLGGLPLLGVWLAGKPVSQYFEFPPRTRYVEHEPFSWPVFTALALLILGAIIPFVVRIVSVASPRSRVASCEASRLPLVGMGWNRVGRTVVGVVLEPILLDDIAPGTYIHPALARLHRGR